MKTVPAGRVSRNAPLVKPRSQWKTGGMARLSENDNAVVCSCGAGKASTSTKARGKWADKHVDDHHGGRSIWL